MAKKPTIDDVARLAGVSTTTVSRVINKVTTVKKRHRLAVEDAIKQLKYIPDVSAQRLAGAKSRTVGFIIPPYEDMFRTFYTSVIIRGVGESAGRLGFDLLLHLTRPVKEDALMDNVFNPGFVRGLLFADIVGNEEMVEIARERGVPFVIMNYFSRDSKDHCIGFESKKATVEVMDYLVGLGHRRIATITGKLFVKVGMERFEGYKEGLEKYKIEFRKDYVAEGDWSAKSGRLAMEKLLKVKPIPTAVFAAGDEMALEAIRVVEEAGLKVPKDISIVGFDDIPAASYGEVPLTTIRQPFVELGKKAVEALNEVIAGKAGKPLRILLPTEFVERKSCAPPPAK